MEEEQHVVAAWGTFCGEVLGLPSCVTPLLPLQLESLLNGATLDAGGVAGQCRGRAVVLGVQ